jgi:hypothetical protein
MYTSTWKKYLPVIKLLLKRSASADQMLKLNRTDFEKNNRNRKPACSFTIELTKGRLNTLTQSVPAKDLLEILMQDDAGKTLLRQHNYTISLDSDLVLKIKDTSPVLEPSREEAAQKGITAEEKTSETPE